MDRPENEPPRGFLAGRADPEPESRGRATLRLMGGDSPGDRAEGMRRLARVGAVLLGLGVVGYGLIVGVGAAVAWLDRRPTYRFDFGTIDLEPPPPKVIGLSAPEFLERVRARSNWPESSSVLETDLQALSAAFALHSPWVEAVEGIETAYPDRVVVHLKYRRPVARVIAEVGSTIVVDRQGYVLPVDDLERGRVSGLVRLQLVRVVRSPHALETRPGRRIAPPDSPTEARAMAASALAGFVLDREESARPGGPPRLLIIDSTRGPDALAALADLDGDGRHSPSADIWLDWGSAPGSEPTGEPSAEAKWRQYREWAETHESLVGSDRPPFLRFGPEKARVVPSTTGSGAARED